MVVVDGNSSIGRDGFDIFLVAVDGGVHFARGGECYQCGIEGNGRGSSHDGGWDESEERNRGKVHILLIVH